MTALGIITCPQWHARPPKHPNITCARAHEIIFHHTDGHHAEIANPKDESLAELIRYAHAIQDFHMGPQRGWNDSGHNFLVGRNGLVIQGRWLTVSQIMQGHMVISAHTLGDHGRPSRNDQIGIEHEHIPGEPMTSAQRRGSAQLVAWISQQYHLREPLPISPHSKYTSTSCPDNLIHDIPRIQVMARQLLNL